MTEKVRKNVTLKSAEWDTLEELKQEHHLKTHGEAIQFLIQNYQQAMSANYQAQVTAAFVKELLHPLLDQVRLRTGYINRNSHLLLNLLNHLIIENGWDVAEYALPHFHDTVPSNLYKKAEAQFEKVVTSRQEKKHMKQEVASYATESDY